MTTPFAASRVSHLAAAQREMTALRKRNTRLMREAQELRADNNRLRRRLFGALYQIYGDWARVNREVGSP